MGQMATLCSRVARAAGHQPMLLRQPFPFGLEQLWPLELVQLVTTVYQRSADSEAFPEPALAAASVAKVGRDRDPRCTGHVGQSCLWHWEGLDACRDLAAPHCAPSAAAGGAISPDGAQSQQLQLVFPRNVERAQRMQLAHEAMYSASCGGWRGSKEIIWAALSRH